MKKTKLIKFMLLPIVFFSITACSSNNTPTLCDCVLAGKKVDEISASLLDKPATKESKDSLDLAIIDRDKICFPYQNMLAVELQKQAEECELLKFNSE